MLQNKTVNGIGVDPDLFYCLVSSDKGQNYVSEKFGLFLARMCSPYGSISSRDEMVKHFVASVAALCKLKERDVSYRKKISRPCLIRLVQKCCGDFSDECIERMNIEEINVPANRIKLYVKLRDDFRDYSIDHIPEMVDVITKYIS